MNPHGLLDAILDGDPIDALPAIEELRQLLTDRQRDHVLTLRRHGADWGFIGKALNITRQSARMRFYH